MKILVFPHDLNMGGSQTNAIELAASVKALGHECIVLGKPGTLCQRIGELGLEFIELPRPSWRPSHNLVGTLRSIAVKRGIDIIHGYEWPPGMAAALAAEALPDTAAVCTVMSMAVAPFLPNWLPLVVGTQQISAVEQASGRLNVSLIEPPVDLIHNQPVAQDVTDHFRRTWGLEGSPLVVIVSRLVPELKSEGILTAIDLAAELAESHPFQLVIVGDGKARGRMEELASRANRRSGRRTVVFTGELIDPRPAYSAADILLGMGGSALRALAFSKPLIVQGEGGYFRTLTPASVDTFRWQGWYGVAVSDGVERLRREITPLLENEGLRRELGLYGRGVVEDFSIQLAAERQIAIYQDAWAARADQKRRVADGVRSFARFAQYQVNQRVDGLRGRRKTDDFNAVPTMDAAMSAPSSSRSRSGLEGPILYFPGVGWDTMAGTDRHLAIELAREAPIIWVDTPYPVHRLALGTPLVSRPYPNVVRLRAPSLPGVQRPVLRQLANRKRAAVALRYLALHGLKPRAVIASTTAPMLSYARDLPGMKLYYATDDFVEAGRLWGVSRRYLVESREANLRSADLVLAVTPELGQHLQRTSAPSRWFPNGVDLERLRRTGVVPAPAVKLRHPIAGVVGQFNRRTALALLREVQRAGISLLLVGPRWFTTTAEEEEFERLAALPGVQWVGEVSRDEIPAYLAQIDVGLTAYSDSMFNRRSYPLKTLEYLAAGIPVVTTNVTTLKGLDRRFVVAANSREFVHRVAECARAQWDRGMIQRSVEGQGWDSRARQLLDWLAEWSEE